MALIDEQEHGVFPQASYLYGQGGPDPYPFSTTAYFNPLQEQGYQTYLDSLQHGAGQGLQNQALAQSLQGGFNQYLGQTGAQADPGYINQIGGSFNPWQNPALDDSVMRANQALTRDFNQGARPYAASSAMDAGQLGSSRHGVQEGLAKQGLADAIGKQTANMYSGGFESGMNRYVQDRASTLNAWGGANQRQQGGWQAAPGMAAMTMAANRGASGGFQDLGVGQSMIGANYQNMANTQLEEQKRMWEASQGQPYENLGWYSNIIQGNAPPAGSVTSTYPGGSKFADIFGGAAMGAGAYDWWNNNFGGGDDRSGMPTSAIWD